MPLPIQTMAQKMHLPVGMRSPFIALLGLVAVACASETEVGYDEAPDSDEESVESEDSDLAVAGRWRMPSSLRDVALGQHVEYDGARRCASGDQPGTRDVKNLLRTVFPDEIREIQGFVCRKIRGGSGLSVHSTGRAMDIFIRTTPGGAADNTKGDRVMAFLIKNAERIGVQFVIWDRSKWKPSELDRPYGGSHPHNDHLHVELTEEAGAKRTPYFNGTTVDGTVAGTERATEAEADGCHSFTLQRDVAESTCVQSRKTELWYRCVDHKWYRTEQSDSKCIATHPLP